MGRASVRHCSTHLSCVNQKWHRDWLRRAGEDKALVKGNLALCRKRRGPTNRPIKGREGPHLPTTSPGSRASPVAHLSNSSSTPSQQPCSRADTRRQAHPAGRPSLLTLPFTHLTLSTPYARHASVTSHHDASPIIITTSTTRPIASPIIHTHAHHARHDGSSALRDTDRRRRQEQEAEHGRAQAATSHRTQPAPARGSGATQDTRVRSRVGVGLEPSGHDCRNPHG
jgi:hypothetical protein